MHSILSQLGPAPTSRSGWKGPCWGSTRLWTRQHTGAALGWLTSGCWLLDGLWNPPGGRGPATLCWSLGTQSQRLPSQPHVEKRMLGAGSPQRPVQAIRKLADEVKNRKLDPRGQSRSSSGSAGDGVGGRDGTLQAGTPASRKGGSVNCPLSLAPLPSWELPRWLGGAALPPASFWPTDGGAFWWNEIQQISPPRDEASHVP